MNSEVVLSPEKTLVGAGSGPSCLESFIKRSVSSIPQVFQLIFFFFRHFCFNNEVNFIYCWKTCHFLWSSFWRFSLLVGCFFRRVDTRESR